MIEEGEYPDVVRDFLAAREITHAAETTEVDRDDVQTALDALAEVHRYLVEGRPAP